MSNRHNMISKTAQNEHAKNLTKWRKALSKKMHEHFKHIEDYDSKAEFHPDRETPVFYEWHFKLNGNTYELCHNKLKGVTTLIGK